MGWSRHYSGFSFPERKKDHIGGSQGNIGRWRNSGGGLRREGCCQAARDTIVLQWHRAPHHLWAWPCTSLYVILYQYHPYFMGEDVRPPRVTARKNRARAGGHSFKATPLACPRWLWSLFSVQLSLSEDLGSKGSGGCQPRASHFLSPIFLHQSAHLSGLFYSSSPYSFVN